MWNFVLCIPGKYDEEGLKALVNHRFSHTSIAFFGDISSQDPLWRLPSILTQSLPTTPSSSTTLSSTKLFIWLHLCFRKAKGEKTYSTAETVPTFMRYLLYQSYKLRERSLVIKCHPILMTVQKTAHLHTAQVFDRCGPTAASHWHKSYSSLRSFINGTVAPLTAKLYCRAMTLYLWNTTHDSSTSELRSMTT